MARRALLWSGVSGVGRRHDGNARSSQRLLREGLEGILRPADEEPDRAARAQVAAGTIDSVTCQVRLVRPDGGIVWVLHSLGLLTDELSGDRHFVSHYADITKVRQTREKLRRHATHDSMTGLPNRAGFREGLDRILAHPARAGRRLAVRSWTWTTSRLSMTSMGTLRATGVAAH